MASINILAIIGSQRKDSLNLQLAQKAAEVLQGKAVLEILDYTQVPLFNQDIEFPAPDAITKVREKVHAAHAVWFFTPEHNHFFPAALKNLIDWLSRPWADTNIKVLSGKPAAISGISPGMCGTALAQDHLVTLLSFLDMAVMNQPRLTIPNAFGQVKDGKLLLDASLKHLEKQADAFLAFIQNTCKK